MKTAKILKLYNETRKLALEEAITEARIIMKQHPICGEFVLAMGSFFFVDSKTGETIDTYQSEYIDYKYRYTDRFKYFKKLNDLMSEWDSVLKITGEGIRFSADGEIITNW